MEIRIDGKQAQAWNYLTDNTTNEILYGGAAGGGKSFLGCLWEIYMRTTYPKTRGMIGRSKIRNLEESTLVTYFDVAAKMGYESGKHYRYNSQKHYIEWMNGSRTVLKDLFLYPSDPDFTSLGSTEYTNVFIDEAPEIRIKAFDIAKSRIRYKLNQYGLVPKILMTANPSPGWVKQRYISKDDRPVSLKENQAYVHARVDDNPDKQFRDMYRMHLENIINPYDRRRLLHGDWDAAPQAENPFSTHFDRAKHVSEKAVHIEGRHIYISLDFNLDPFGFIFQHKWRDNKGFHVWTFDEAKIKNANLEAGIDLINKRYGEWRSQIIITGDKMGDKQDFGRRDRASYYERIKQGLRLSSKQMEIHPNPTHENSRTDVNYVLYHMDDFIIHPVNCKETVYDMESVEVDAFGKIKKTDRKNLAQRADFLDCVRYSCNDRFVQSWIKWHQKQSKNH